jgi:DNA-binding beta-propeller fold protein YncE
MAAMCITPDGSTLYVCLLETQSYTEDGTGKVAIIDTGTFTNTGAFDTEIDPHDIVATDAGVVAVSSGSGQHTYIQTYNAASGVKVGSAGIYMNSYIDLHPDQIQVYMANTGLSPSDIGKYVINPDGTITSKGDSPYHGDHRMSGNVWVAPSGDFLVTRGGDVFVSSMNEAEDMTFIAEMAEYAITGIGFAQGKGCILTLEQDTMRMYDYNNYSYKTRCNTGYDYERMFVKGNTVYIQRSAGLFTEFVAVDLK